MLARLTAAGPRVLAGTGLDEAAAYIFAPENEGDLVGVAMVAEPAAIGALRLDTASPDPSYRQLLRRRTRGQTGGRRTRRPGYATAIADRRFGADISRDG